MRRVLLIGKDPLFAWALEKRISTFGCHLEHIYTLAEAHLRLNRFHYDAVLFDGVARGEMEKLRENLEPVNTLFLLNDTVDETIHEISSFPHLISLSKETALSQIVSSLKELH